jgi:hypothetical protein
MSEETPNKSEERLQRYAKERRAQGGDFALHPATRRMLQGEVARTFGAKGTPPAKSRGWLAWLNSWNGRLAIGATAAVVIAGSWVIWNQRLDQHAMQLARAEMPLSKSMLAGTEGTRGIVSAEKELAMSDSPAPVATRAEADKKSEALARPVALFGANSTKQDGDANQVAADKATAMDGLAVNSSVARYQNQSGVAATFSNGASLSLAPVAQNAVNFFTANSPADAQKPNTANQQFNYAAPGQNFAQAGQGLANNSSQISQNQMQVTGGAVPALGGALTFTANEPKASFENNALYKEQAAPQIAGRSDAYNYSVQDNRARTASPAAPVPTTAPVVVTSLAPAQEPQSRAGESLSSAAAVIAPAEAAPLSRFSRLNARVSDEAKSKALAESTLPETSPVLNDFIIEQRGNTVRVVDGDGSVYNGTVETPITAQKDQGIVTRGAIVAKTLESTTAPQELSFRANGSNVTLRQSVVVNARFSLDTNATRASRYAGGAQDAGRKLGTDLAVRRFAPAKDNAFGSQSNVVTNEAATIEGTVRIGTTNQQLFRAYRRGP